MSDEGERLARIARAKNELALTEEAFDKLRGALVEKMFETPMEASAFRERIYSAVTALDQVRAMLHQATFDEAMVNYESLLAEHGYQR